MTVLSYRCVQCGHIRSVSRPCRCNKTVPHPLGRDTIVGLTATQYGMTAKQQAAMKALWQSLGISCLHHGDCLGGDIEGERIALLLKAFIVVHPPDNNRKRAFSHDYDLILPELPYRKRNENIVSMSGLLCAAPAGKEERYIGSGTWMTIRIARKMNRLVYIVYPDGSIDLEGD